MPCHAMVTSIDETGQPIILFPQGDPPEAEKEDPVYIYIYSISMALHGMAQHGTAWHGTARHGTARHGTARHGMARHGMAWHGMSWHGTAQHGMAQHSTAWRYGVMVFWRFIGVWYRCVH